MLISRMMALISGAIDLGWYVIFIVDKLKYISDLPHKAKKQYLQI